MIHAPFLIFAFQKELITITRLHSVTCAWRYLWRIDLKLIEECGSTCA
jgi:hypothetical protein